MPLARESSATRSSYQYSLPGEKTVIAVLLVVFLMLHVVAGALLQGRARTGPAPVPDQARTLYD